MEKRLASSGRTVFFYQGNYPQSHPTHDRKSYEYVKHQIRRLKRNIPNHMDVLWYTESLALNPWRTDASIRTYYSFINKAWKEMPRKPMFPLRNTHTYCLQVQVFGPVGKLP